MILRLTAKLARKLGMAPLPALPRDQGMNPLLDWHAHLFTVPRKQYILATNTASLYSLVIPGRGITTERPFIQALGAGLQAFLVGQGHPPHAAAALLAPDGEAIFTKITDRRILGSMNDLIFQAKFMFEEQQTPWDVSRNLNETPMSYLKYRAPRDAFQALLRQAGHPDGPAQRTNNVIYLDTFRPSTPKG